jgi:hypothetical protein
VPQFAPAEALPLSARSKPQPGSRKLSVQDLHAGADFFKPLSPKALAAYLVTLRYRDFVLAILYGFPKSLFNGFLVRMLDLTARSLAYEGNLSRHSNPPS